MLATPPRPDAGRARVCGFDVVAEPHQVRRLVGLTGQYAALDEELTGVVGDLERTHPEPHAPPIVPASPSAADRSG